MSLSAYRDVERRYLYLDLGSEVSLRQKTNVKKSYRNLVLSVNKVTSAPPLSLSPIEFLSDLLLLHITD